MALCANHRIGWICAGMGEPCGISPGLYRMRRLDRMAGLAGIRGSTTAEISAMAELAGRHAPTRRTLGHFRNSTVTPRHRPTGNRPVMAICGHAGRNAATRPRHGHFVAFLATVQRVRGQCFSWMNGKPIRRVEMAVLTRARSPGLVPAAAGQSCSNQQKNNAKGSQMKRICSELHRGIQVEAA